MSSAKIPLLFKLPNAWLIAFLSEWLDMPSIGKLDTAISTKKYRSQFLNSLQSMRSIAVDSFSDCRCLGVLDGDSDWTGQWWRWLCFREIYVERASLYGNDVRFDLVILSMRNVEIENCEDDDLQYLVRNCPSLRRLGITTRTSAGQQVVSAVGLLALANLHQSLEEFSYLRRKGLF